MVDELFDTLETLVERWSKAASDLEGYRAVTDKGDSPQLLLSVRKLEDGSFELTVMSARDIFGSITPKDLYQGESSPDEPGIPYASIVFSKKAPG